MVHLIFLQIQNIWRILEKTVYLDTGPLVALFRKRDQYHQWAKGELNKAEMKFVTCEAVLAESLFLTQNSRKVIHAISEMINDEMMQIKPVIEHSSRQVFELLSKYHDQNTSLADVSLLSLYNEEKSPIFTIDSDFLLYRDLQGNPLNLISPYKS